MTNTEAIIVKDNNFVQPNFITRLSLPSKRVPKDQQSIWSIIKNAIGRVSLFINYFLFIF